MVSGTERVNNTVGYVLLKMATGIFINLEDLSDINLPNNYDNRFIRPPEENYTLQAVHGQVGVFSVQGPDYGNETVRERPARDNEGEQEDRVLEAEVVPVVLDAFPVPDEIVVDGVLEKSLDFTNPRVRALVAALTLLLLAFVVAIGLASSKKQTPVSKNIVSSATPLQSVTPLSSTSVTPLPSDVPTKRIPAQPSTSPTKKGWILMQSSANVSPNILTSDHYTTNAELSGDGSHMIVKSTKAGSDRNISTIYVMKWTLANGWKSVLYVEEETLIDLPFSISYDGSTFALYLFGTLRVYEQLGIKSQHRNHFIEVENIDYTPYIALSCDGNRLAILHTNILGRQSVMIYDFFSALTTWTQTDVIFVGNQTKLGMNLSNDGSTIIIEEQIEGDGSVVHVQVLKYNETDSSWRELNESLKITSRTTRELGLSGNGNTIVFDTVDPVITNIFQFNESLAKYEQNMAVTNGSSPCLSGSGTRMAVVFSNKREARVYDILGNQMTQTGESIDLCDESKQCEILSLRLSYNGDKLAVNKFEPHSPSNNDCRADSHG